MACSASPVHEMRAHAAVVRFQPDGGIDDTFGVDGIAVVPPHSTAGGAGPAVVATVGNSILLGGQITDVALGFNVPSDAAIWRFTPGGQLDRSFGAAGGIVRSDFVEVDNVKSLIPLPDGRLSVLVSGAAESLGPAQPCTAIRHGSSPPSRRFRRSTHRNACSTPGSVSVRPSARSRRVLIWHWT